MVRVAHPVFVIARTRQSELAVSCKLEGEGEGEANSGAEMDEQAAL